MDDSLAITVEDLYERKEADPDLQVLDVRPQDQWDEVHIPGSIHIPLDEVPERAMAELDPTRPVAVICRAGGAARIASESLGECSTLMVVRGGGVPDWRDAGYPVEAA